MATRNELHRAKMARKAARTVEVGFTPIEDKRFAPLRLRLRMQGQPVTFNVSTDARRRVGHGSIAQANRHTGKVHKHLREIARRAA